MLGGLTNVSYICTMSIVYFKATNHRYINSEGIPYESVSGLWKPYAKPFCAESVSVKKAYQDLELGLYNSAKKLLGYDSEELIPFLHDNSKYPLEMIMTHAKEYSDTWEAKSAFGTAFHKKMEDLDRELGYAINNFNGKKYPLIHIDVKKGYDNQSPATPLMDLPDGYIPEFLAKSDNHKVAGQIDKLFVETIDGKRYVDIDDWKTDKEILMKPAFFDRTNGGFASLYSPFDHIYDTNYWKYCLKISTYARMLEMEGFIVRSLAFTHVVVSEDLEIQKSTRYNVPYKPFEVDLAMSSKC